jgi:hypothetical protein
VQDQYDCQLEAIIDLLDLEIHLTMALPAFSTFSPPPKLTFTSLFWIYALFESDLLESRLQTQDILFIEPRSAVSVADHYPLNSAYQDLTLESLRCIPLHAFIAGARFHSPTSPTEDASGDTPPSCAVP